MDQESKNQYLLTSGGLASCTEGQAALQDGPVGCT